MDRNSTPRASIVIATYNRADTVVRTLAALAAQSVPEGTFEVVLVSDGCVDDTVARASQMELPYPLAIVEQDNGGPSLARNAGAQRARAELLIFLDDDIEASATFVAGHLAGHENATCRPFVQIGYLPTRLPTQRGLYASALRGWWETIFDRMAEPGHRFAYSDLLSGNFSLAAELFEKVGGFQRDLRCHEDYELGYRLIEAGACFGFSREASGVHEERTDFNRSLRRQFDEGVADVWLARNHPSLTKGLRLGNFHWSRITRFAQRLAFTSQGLAAMLANVTRLLLGLADLLRFRRVWRRLADLLLMHHYWRGVVASVDGQEDLLKRIAASEQLSSEDHTLLQIDLQHGLEAAEKVLNEKRPQGVVLKWGRLLFGTVPAEPGLERLHAGHLRSLLCRDFADEYLRAAGLQALQDADRRSPSPGSSRTAPSSDEVAPIDHRASAR